MNVSSFIHMNNSVHSQTTAQLSTTCCNLLQVHDRKLGVHLKVRPKILPYGPKKTPQTKEQIVKFEFERMTRK